VDGKLVAMHYTKRTVKSVNALFFRHVMILHEDGLRLYPKHVRVIIIYIYIFTSAISW
jgi:hypothetical protein